MKILVLNCGSSSIKYQLIEMEQDKPLCRGVVARIGEQASYIQHETRENSIKTIVPVLNHREGLKIIVDYLLNEKHGVLKDISEIFAIGHRVVHGGEIFLDPTLITEDVIKKIRECCSLAPLHNPANLVGIEEAEKLFPNIPHVAVFDTAFHKTIPKKAYMYAIPYEFYEQYGIRKYGFHGTSCRYVSMRASEILRKPLDQLKMIVCHLGNGVTVDAIEWGRSIDTSMGLTPLEGLMMGTRSGDIDPGVIFHLHKKANLNIEEIENILNHKSGLLGVSGVSNDMRDIIKRAKEGDERCKLALEMFVYRVKKYIGSYAAVMGGLDVLVFTAGIGENSPIIRSMICENLSFLGIKVNEELNSKTIGFDGIISTPDSKISVLVVVTNEEKMIALETLETIKNKADRFLQIGSL